MSRKVFGFSSERDSCLRAIAACSWIPQLARDAISLMQDEKFDEAKAILNKAIQTATSRRDKYCLDVLYSIALAGNDSSACQYLPHTRMSHYL